MVVMEPEHRMTEENLDFETELERLVDLDPADAAPAAETLASWLGARLERPPDDDAAAR